MTRVLRRYGAAVALPLALATLGAGCATAGSSGPQPLPSRSRCFSPMDPTELWRASRRPAEQPLRLVTNEDAAGRQFLATPARSLTPSAPGAEHLVRRMRATLAQEKGVGIAAPQVGISRRVILVQRFDSVGNRRGPCPVKRCPVEVYFNPVVLERAAERVLGWEGCLSVPAGFAKVWRARWVTVAYVDPRGEPQQERVEGFTARIFQHEIDHLDGTLFLERKVDGPLTSRDDYRRMRQQQAGAAAGAASQPATDEPAAGEPGSEEEHPPQHPQGSDSAH